MTGKCGHRDQINFAISKPSMLPGMQISVMTNPIPCDVSSKGRAWSAEVHSITHNPNSETASAVRVRSISSSSTTSTLEDMIRNPTIWILVQL